MPLNGLRWSRNSGSANCDMPQSAVFGRPGGWVDAERQPTKRLGTKAAKAVFANVMIETLNIPRPAYVPFEALWGETGLQNSYSSGIDRNVNEDLKKQIKESLR